MYSRRTTLWFLGISVLIVLGLALYLTSPFLSPVASAIILAVVFYPLHQKVLRWAGNNRGKASLISTLALFFLFCVPVIILLTVAANEAIAAAQYFTRRTAEEGGFLRFVSLVADRIASFIGRWVDISRYDVKGTLMSHFQQAGVWMLGSGASIVGRLFSVLANSFITVIIIFFLFREGDRWVIRIAEALPITNAQAKRLLSNISDTIVANVYGIVSVGAAQGLLTGIAMLIVGLPSPLLLGMGAGFASVVPIVGASLIWIPAGLYLLFVGSLWKGIFVIAWGALVVSMADNIIRPWVVSGKVELHPLVLLFFILGGVEAFGFLGLFLGPVVASVLAVLFVMFRDELVRSDAELSSHPATNDTK